MSLNRNTNEGVRSRIFRFQHGVYFFKSVDRICASHNSLAVAFAFFLFCLDESYERKYALLDKAKRRYRYLLLHLHSRFLFDRELLFDKLRIFLCFNRDREKAYVWRCSAKHWRAAQRRTTIIILTIQSYDFPWQRCFASVLPIINVGSALSRVYDYS